RRGRSGGSRGARSRHHRRAVLHLQRPHCRDRRARSARAAPGNCRGAPAAMTRRTLALLAVAALVAGCATRPINAPIDKVDAKAGYRYLTTRARSAEADDTLLILAFSGGGTRAAAFSYGVLEELRRTELTVNGRKKRMLDQVDIVTGVSGGSFTAL